MSALVAVIVRTVVTGGLALLVGWLTDLPFSDEEKGANIGGGLMMFAVVCLVSAVWAFVDARRSGDWPRTALVWLAVAVIVGLLAAWRAQGFSSSPDGDVLLSDLAQVSTFIAGLVLVPAAVGAALGSVSRRG